MIRLIFKFMTLHSRKKTVTIHILPNISRSIINITMKFGQLQEHMMRNIFWKNHNQNVVKKLFPNLFL